jgi:membrane protease subunit (stomatin/prohibitin family)
MTAEQKSEAPQTIQNPKERIMAMLAAQQAQQSQAQQTQEVPQPEQACSRSNRPDSRRRIRFSPPKGRELRTAAV